MDAKYSISTFLSLCDTGPILYSRKTCIKICAASKFREPYNTGTDRIHYEHQAYTNSHTMSTLPRCYFH